jgi:hypothetical protein
MATALLTPEGYQGDVKLIHNEGFVYADTNLYVKDSASDYTLRSVSLFLGCLMKNWKVNFEEMTEELLYSCNNGSLTIPTGKKYKLSCETMNTNPMLMAALMGHKISKYSATNVGKIEAVEEITETIVVGATSKITLTRPALFTDLIKILKVYRKSDKTYWSAGAAAADAGRTFTLAAGTTDAVLTFEHAGTASFVNGEEFVITRIYDVAMAYEGDAIHFEDGETFSNTFDFRLSWLIRQETGVNRGRKGCLTAVLKNAQRTGSFDIGGDAQALGSIPLEFAVNNANDGDVEFHWKWFSAA